MLVIATAIRSGDFFLNTHHFFIAPTRAAALAVPAVLAAALWATGALAQPSPSPNLTPAPPLSEAAPASFKSATEGYQPYTDEATINWKAANDTVAQIGGWRAYAKEASAPSTTPTPTPSAAAASATGAAKP